MIFWRILSFPTLLLLLISGCENPASLTEAPEQPIKMESDIQLKSLSPDITGIDFNNRIQEEGMVNIFTWHFLYNGAGVAAGDINNDGLPDLYFAGNMVPDKLYINKGDFTFEDITANAGISSQIWSSGVTMADVNADGLLDIYVCKNSPTGVPENNRNKLYINQGKNLFREQATTFGIDDIGFSVQSTFFDADQDGDLDMYLANQPFDEFARLVNRPEVVAGYTQTDRIYFNENGKFIDKTAALGLTNSRYGLQVSLGDFDLNGWTDIYVTNDYHHADHLYLNSKGIFYDALPSHTGHVSFYSMGADVGDINEDGWLDIFTLDMAFDDHVKSKTNMGSMDQERFWSIVADQKHYQYMQNGLQVNNGLGYFSEVAQVAGIAKSDWSYSTLFADLDLDADQDILITNGVLRDLQNNDFNTMVKSKYQGMVGPENYRDILRDLPSNPVANIIFRNDGHLQFNKLAPEAGFDTPGFSHGMVYCDLNGDGLLDVVINNMNAPASVYKNVSTTNGHFLKIKLKGPKGNPDGLGCSVIVYANGKKQVNTMQTSRGYFSAVEPILHFGTGTSARIDSIKVYWDAGTMSLIKNIKADQTLTIDFNHEKRIPRVIDPLSSFASADQNLADFLHQETNFDDYRDQVLLPYKLSQNGPHISVGDVNGDRLDDFFIGGAAGQSGVVFIQSSAGFEPTMQASLLADKNCEDQASTFVDVDGDGDLDLIVVSGSNEFSAGDPRLKDRLYINDGVGNFSKANSTLFPDYLINGQSIIAFDADGDKDLDLFIGGRLVGGQYAIPASSKILINEGGRYTDQSNARAPFLASFGMVTDGISDDIDGDGDIDLVVVGEWMAPTVLLNDGNGKFEEQTIDSAGAGLWWTIEKGDFDEDGDSDFVLGNLGWNNKFGGARGTKLEVFSNDIDQNGNFDVVLATTKEDELLPVRGRECSSQEMPFILEKFPTYESYAHARLTDIYSEEMLQKSVHKKLKTMTSLYLQNNGAVNFTTTDLPIQCQTGPIKAICPSDLNKDGHLDFMYGGNHFPTEVETARYDGLAKGICIGDGSGNFDCRPMTTDGKIPTEDVRSIVEIKSSTSSYFLVGINDGKMQTLSLGVRGE
jgi:hypothetical protein